MTTDLTIRLDALAEYVGRRAARLQVGYQADRADAVAALARLRRALTTGVAIDPDIWDLFEAESPMPEILLGDGDDLSRSEMAAVVALSMFSRHQQSRRDTSMHRPGHLHSLGRAVGNLSTQIGGPGVERRFRALTRAPDLPSALPHLRGLISQLRAERIPLDYGRLAVDFFHLQHPNGVHSVRVRWTRDFHRRPTTTSDPSPSGTEIPGDAQ